MHTTTIIFRSPLKTEVPAPLCTIACWTHYCLLFSSKSKHLLEPSLQGCLWISPPASVVVSQLTEMKTTAIIQLSKPSGLPGSLLIRDADRWNWHCQLGRNFTVTDSIQHTGSSPQRCQLTKRVVGRGEGVDFELVPGGLLASHSPVALSQKVLSSSRNPQTWYVPKPLYTDRCALVKWDSFWGHLKSVPLLFQGLFKTGDK